MDIKNIMTIIEKVEQGSISRFEYSEKDFKLLLEKGEEGKTIIGNQQINQTAVVSAPSVAEVQEGCVIKSPIVGTFYSKASPESEPFVSVGDQVKKGDTVCIVEAMKLFNEVQADASGVVQEILLKDGDVVSFDQPIIILK